MWATIMVPVMLLASGRMNIGPEFITDQRTLFQFLLNLITAYYTASTTVIGVFILFILAMKELWKKDYSYA